MQAKPIQKTSSLTYQATANVVYQIVAKVAPGTSVKGGYPIFVKAGGVHKPSGLPAREKTYLLGTILRENFKMIGNPWLPLPAANYIQKALFAEMIKVNKAKGFENKIQVKPGELESYIIDNDDSTAADKLIARAIAFAQVNPYPPEFFEAIGDQKHNLLAKGYKAISDELVRTAEEYVKLGFVDASAPTQCRLRFEQDKEKFMEILKAGEQDAKDYTATLPPDGQVNNIMDPKEWGMEQVKESSETEDKKEPIKSGGGEK